MKTRFQIFTVFLTILLTQNAFASIASKKVFISELSEYGQTANQKILKTRKKLETLSKTPSKRLSSDNKAWLAGIAKKYRIKDWNPSNKNDWQTLLSRVDVVPTSLLVAQAAIESAWGTSRFARAGNNLFGQWCYQKGCGIIPKRRSPGSRHEVKKFKSVAQSVSAYIYNLNTNPAYKALRQRRTALRQADKPVTGYALAEGLNHYSQLGEKYVGIVRSVISRYKLNHEVNA